MSKKRLQENLQDIFSDSDDPVPVQTIEPVTPKAKKTTEASREVIRERKGDKGAQSKAPPKKTRIPSGIIGLDEVTEGGLRENTVNVVLGASGTGKSTFAMQFILQGLDNEEQALYITLDTTPKQIIKECILWGWDRVQKYVDKQLFFFATTGSDFQSIVDNQLPKLVEARKEYKVPTRIAIDPLTPIMWAEKDKSAQRELLTKLFGMLKEIGAVMATVEEYSRTEDVSEGGGLIPVFLADSVFRLRYQPIGGAFNRTLEIIKMRGTRHGEEVYPYIFSRGAGIVVRTTPVYHEEKAKGYDPIFHQAIKAAEREKAPKTLLDTLEKMRATWSYDYSPQEVLSKILTLYGIEKRE